MIDKKEFCVESLVNLLHSGGESTLKSNMNTDPLRPLVDIEILLGWSRDYKGKINGRVKNLLLSPGESVFEQDCFDYDCFQDSGTWTSLVKSNTTRLNSEGGVEYFVRGDKDKEGNIYIVDIGYIYEPTGEFVIREESVPIYKGGFFYGKESITNLTKLIVLKKITPTSVDKVLYHYGDYKNNDSLSRTSYKHLLEYSFEDQKCDIEELALSTLSFLLTSYRRTIPNQVIYREHNYVDPTIRLTIENNLSRLSRLIETRDNVRKGSIPLEVATYSEFKDIYEPEVDDKFICFEEGCFEVGVGEDCFNATETNKLSGSIYVSNRAVAWLLFTYISYQNIYNTDEYNNTIILLSDYLKGQVNYKYKLLYEGWSNDSVYENSRLLERNALSTSVITCISLIKSYELLNDASYLEIAVYLYKGIFSELYDYKNKVFFKERNSRDSGIEELVYGLLISTYTKRIDIVNNLFKIGKLKLKSSLVLPAPSATNYLSLSFLNSFYKEETLSLKDTVINNYLLFNLYDYLDKEYFQTGFRIDNLLNSFDDIQYSNRSIKTLFYTSQCLLDNNIFRSDHLSFFGEDIITPIILEQDKIFNRLVNTIPLEFGWFSKESVTPNGNLYKILKTFANVLSLFRGKSQRIIKSTYIKNDKNVDLIRWGTDLKLTRFFRESRDNFIKRIDLTLKGSANTKRDITEVTLANNINISNITEPWRDILSCNHPIYHPGSAVINKAGYSGNKYYSSNVVDITVDHPINNTDISFIESISPAGIKRYYKENLLLLSIDEYRSPDNSCLMFDGVVYTPPCGLLMEMRPELIILKEDGDYILNEDCP